MTDYMRKTKKELVQLIEEMIHEDKETDGLLEESEELKTFETQIKDLEKQRETLKTELNELQERNTDLERRNKELGQIKSDLESQLDQKNRQYIGAEKAVRREEKEKRIFKAFCDALFMNNGCTAALLRDDYRISHIAGALSPSLSSDSEQPPEGRKIFEFIEYNEAVELKQSIDRAVAERKQFRTKDVKFKRLYRIPGKFKIRVKPVNDQVLEGILLSITKD